MPFYTADPGGFFLAEVFAEAEGDGDEEPPPSERAGCISAVRYDAFGFIGFYIVRPEWRRRGIGRALWDTALEHLDGLAIGLDGVPAQRGFYERSGFEPAYRNIRYQQNERWERDRYASGLALTEVLRVDDDVLAFDRACFGASREAFLRAWITQEETVAIVARALDREEVLGFGVGRLCREGTKVGPLFAKRPDVAAAVFDAVGARTLAPWYLDVPQPNMNAVAIANDREMKPIFETARMWRGTPPALPLEWIYGVTSFELG
ncbi:MAG: GNAT family N-acetyltransferase [Candidatus Eremiobacteraeota bacterium]|nr:GNAT family N-acetyltransferase [Candidatus Eremiobacteraeota bacterium]